MTHVTCRLTAKNRDQLRNHTLGNRVWATFIYSTVPSRNRKEHFFQQLCGDYCCMQTNDSVSFGGCRKLTDDDVAVYDGQTDGRADHGTPN